MSNINMIDDKYYSDEYSDNEYKYLNEIIIGKDENALINDVIHDLHVHPITLMHIDDWLMAHPSTFLTMEKLIPIIIDSAIEEDDYSNITGVVLQINDKITDDDYDKLLKAMSISANGQQYIGDVILHSGINSEEMIKKYYEHFNMSQITSAWCSYKDLRNVLFTYVVRSDNVDYFMDTINGRYSYTKHYYSWSIKEIYNESNIFNELRLGIVL